MHHLLLKLFLSLTLIAGVRGVSAQEENNTLYLGLTGGLLSYQGDLQPNSFSFNQSNAYFSAFFRKPVSNKFSIKGGFGTGSIKAADANNRDYLKIRNLSFYSRVNEGFLSLEYSLFNQHQYRFTPFGSAGVVVFHFNPYTVDAAGTQVYLQPLGTEGQGLRAYPDRKPYKLTQIALGFSGGFRYKVNNNMAISIEAVQRKTFTDYLDDVSKSYAAEDILLAGSGPRTVELAYRGDELGSGGAYPKEGEQRGTPTEMDWYYYAGITLEVNLQAISSLFQGLGSSKQDWYNKRCPRVN